jgi:hypothetical protein
LISDIQLYGVDHASIGEGHGKERCEKLFAAHHLDDKMRCSKEEKIRWKRMSEVSGMASRAACF